jgi:hypothetical protein
VHFTKMGGKYKNVHKENLYFHKISCNIENIEIMRLKQRILSFNSMDAHLKHIYIHTNIHIYIYICICMHTYTHTYKILKFFQ